MIHWAIIEDMLQNIIRVEWINVVLLVGALVMPWIVMCLFAILLTKERTVRCDNSPNRKTSFDHGLGSPASRPAGDLSASTSDRWTESAWVLRVLVRVDRHGLLFGQGIEIDIAAHGTNGVACY